MKTNTRQMARILDEEERGRRLLVAMYHDDVVRVPQTERSVLGALYSLAGEGLAKVYPHRSDETAKVVCVGTITDAGRSYIETLMIDDVRARQLRIQDWN